MSWLCKSLQSNDADSPPHSPSSPSVKDELSVISDSIGRQLRGVANFLAPPPSLPSNPEAANSQPSDSPPQSSQALLGIRNDLAEIGGSLKSGLSKLSSNFLQFKDDKNSNQEGDYDDDDVAGINEEVIGFVKEISLRPECWIDFPLPLQDDFRMTDAQREHVSNIEHLVPSLARLRSSLRSEMGDGQFWMIYFILLIPRLNERDFEILSTPQAWFLCVQRLLLKVLRRMKRSKTISTLSDEIDVHNLTLEQSISSEIGFEVLTSEIAETRNVLLQKLQNKRNVKVESSKNSNNEREGENTTSREDVTGIVNATGGLKISDEENSKQFLKEKINNSTSMDNQKKLKDEEDVSFSDLEDDDSDFSARLSASRKAKSIRAPSPSGSSDWVQLSESSDTQVGPRKARQSFSHDKDSDAESADWHKVDEFD
ncbi:unnamed protein product [Dovyalis caffra]|uniref:BSD domain-containing protein n=1 Tax=Dovyalis caffra TaxID=77055 RepID=A0AAV1S6J9_9ROSI|nr:unnamed protein product [Dovyalis caffra]